MLAQRIATAVVALPVVFALIWIGGWTYTIAAGVLLAIAAAEFAHLKAPWLSLTTIMTAAYAALLAIAAPLIREGAIFLLSGALAVTTLPAVYLWLRRGNRFAERVVWLVCGVLYVGTLGSTIVLIRDLNHELITRSIFGDDVVITGQNGRDWVLFALLSTFAVDTAAYFVGRAIGRHKLAPAISPKKTWEGFFGGYAGGFTVVLILAATLDLDLAAAPALFIAGSLPVAAAAGDLFESWIKRRTGVKDASELIPGHGGLLDRFDSVLFTFPLVFAVARWWA